jgi:hypothetical protein
MKFDPGDLVRNGQTNECHYFRAACNQGCNVLHHTPGKPLNTFYKSLVLI